MGYTDAQGVYTYVEDDPAAPFSDLLNRLGSSVSTQLAAIRDGATAANNTATAWRTKMIRKTAGESTPVNSTALVNDSHLFVDLPVGTWRVETVLSVSGAAAGDVRIAWTFSGTLGASSKLSMGPGQATTDSTGLTVANANRCTIHGFGTAVVYGLDGNVGSGITEDMFYVVTVAGRLQMQIGQGTANATASTFTSASRMFVTQVSGS